MKRQDKSIYDAQPEGVLKRFLKSRITMLMGLGALSLGTSYGINAAKEDTLNLFDTEAEMNVTTAEQLERLVDSDQHPEVQEEIRDDLEDLSKECKNGLEYEAKSILIRKAIDAGLRQEIVKKFLNTDIQKAIEEERLDDINRKNMAHMAAYAIQNVEFNQDAYVDIAEVALVKLDSGSAASEKTAYVKKLFSACAKDGVFNDEEMEYIGIRVLERLMSRPADDPYRQSIERKLGELYIRQNTEKKDKGILEDDQGDSRNR